MFSIHRDAQTSRDQFQAAVLSSGETLNTVPSLRRYVHHFVSTPLEEDAEGYLELWFDDERGIDAVQAHAPLQAMCSPQAPFWLKPLR